jgi:citrate lyase beta subunit
MDIDATPPRRSFLYVPGARPERFAKAMTSGADMVCVDLEDAVAGDAKEAGRTATIAFFGEPNTSGVERLVRINGIRTAEGLADLYAFATASSAPDGILLPKVKSADEARIALDVMAPKHPGVKIHIQMETVEALEAAHEIANTPGIASLVFGGFDMAAGLRVEPHWDALLYARQRLVHAAATAKIDLLDMPFFGLDDEAGLKRETEAAQRIGFTGKTCIHPKQVAIVSAAFSPSAAEIARARDLIAKFEAQDQAFVVIDGVILEAPVLQRLYRIVAIAERIGA